MTSEQNIQGHAFNALTYALADRDIFVKLADRERAATAVVAAAEPLIVKRAVAATCRQLAEQLGFDDAEALREVAASVDAFDNDRDACCPVCQETTCDDGCPLAPVRNRWQADAEPRPASADPAAS